MTSKALVRASLAAGLLAAAIVLGAGCDGPGSRASLENTSWRLTGWSVGGQDPSEFTITAEFREARIGGTSAVNQYGGAYTADDGTFSVGELVSTMIAGPELEMRAEQAYLRLLSAAESYRRDGDTLRLSGPGDDALVYTRSLATPQE